MLITGGKYFPGVLFIQAQLQISKTCASSFKNRIAYAALQAAFMGAVLQL